MCGRGPQAETEGPDGPEGPGHGVSPLTEGLRSYAAARRQSPQGKAPKAKPRRQSPEGKAPKAKPRGRTADGVPRANGRHPHGEPLLWAR
ncbi:hypothetical protein SSPO_060320 [Streptomyces antimycoticus]|uniref:Uncharacterized protein n=1 Tax=Streptomyces antimycoticus TaxID=68175 RepID=A0A499UN67_9ACTN|nr:hypothetical protein SSPO_060320 [Streptomyces antimycoticus]